MSSLVLSTLSQGLIFFIAALGVSITFRILDFPDLSVDGTFALGGAVTALALQQAVPAPLAVLVAVVAGACMGLVTGALHVKLKMTPILSGIVVLIGLYSINLRIMGSSNVHFFSMQPLFQKMTPMVTLGVLVAVAWGAKSLYDRFFVTELGYVLKATGQNPVLVTGLGADTGRLKLLGLAISNGTVALAGSLFAQYQGFADVGMGTGMLVSGIVAVVLGELVLRRHKGHLFILVGAVLYRGLIAVALSLGVQASDMKLLTALLMVGVLSWDNAFLKKGRPADAAHRTPVEDI